MAKHPKRGAPSVCNINTLFSVLASVVVCTGIVRFQTYDSRAQAISASFSSQIEPPADSPVVLRMLQNLLEKSETIQRAQEKAAKESAERFEVLSIQITKLKSLVKEVRVPAPAPASQERALVATPAATSSAPKIQGKLKAKQLLAVIPAEVVCANPKLMDVTAKFHKAGVETGTEKVTVHAFDIPYAFFFERTVEQAVNLLEVGERSDTASLKFWKAALPKAIVYADIEKAAGKPLDIIVSSGSSNEQAWGERFQELFPKLRAGGWYVIEGYNPSSETTEKMFQMIQVMHRMYLRKEFVNYTVWNGVDHEVKSVHFYDQIIFIEKGEPMCRWNSVRGMYDARKFPPGNIPHQITAPSFNTELGQAAQKDWTGFVDEPTSAFSSPHNKWLLDEITDGFHHDSYDDKVRVHTYDVTYAFFLHRLRSSGRKIKMMEIGTAGGNSVRLWDEYFDKLDYHGVDIAVLDGAKDAVRDVNKKRNHEKMKVHYGDAENQTSLRGVAKDAGVNLADESSKFDVIIDDGSHWSLHHITTLNGLYPYLKNGGFYVIEDMGATAWVEEQAKPYSCADKAYSLCKSIGVVQLMNTMYPHSNKWSKWDSNLNDMFRSVSYYDQMVVFQKGHPNPRWDYDKKQWDASLFPKNVAADKIPIPAFNADKQGNDWISLLSSL
jgi:hypothetical protein